jgi:beta-lactamase superfamily II metal-dependent hydrolase
VTHYHRDHWGGVSAVAKLIPVARFYDHGRMSELADDPDFPRFNTAYQEASRGESKTLHPRDEIPMRRAQGAAEVRVRILAANRETLKRPGADNPACQNAKQLAEDPSDNARSAGFLLTFGNFHFLDLGDLTWNIEQQLVCPVNSIGEISLYQVSHHGAANSNPPTLISSVKPKAAVMNNGPRKGGEADTFPRLAGIPLYQLHRNLATGDIDNAPAERTANLGPEDGCTGNYIKATVAPDGSSFTITNGRTKQVDKYTVR